MQSAAYLPTCCCTKREESAPGLGACPGGLYLVLLHCCHVPQGLGLDDLPPDSDAAVDVVDAWALALDNMGKSSVHCCNTRTIGTGTIRG